MTFRIYLGDAVDMLRMSPDESIDLIVTDTAYESLEKHRAVGTTTRLKQSDASSNEWFSIFGNERFEEFFREAFRVLKKNTHLYFYCDEETADIAKPIGRAAGFTFWKSLVWAKTRQGMKPDADDLTVEHQAMGMGYHYRSSREFILFFEKGKRKLTDLGVRDVLPFPAIKNGYPTEKPVDLNKVLIRLSSEPGDIVCDPFMGSGSTGVAAVKLGRTFMGCDIKESATIEARKRLVAAGGTNQYDTIIVPSGVKRPERPEPPPKKTRAKKAASPTGEDRRSMAESGGIAERDLPSGAAEAAQALREQGEDPVLDVEDVFDPNAPADVREKAWDIFADHAGQLGTKPIPVGEGILETLDALGVPHREGPRQMFEVTVKEGPLPPPPETSFIEQLKAAFAIQADPGCSLDLLEPEPSRHELIVRRQQREIDEKRQGQPKLDGFFPTGPLPGDPSKRLRWADPNVKLTPPARPATCQHGDFRSACVLCRARR